MKKEAKSLEGLAEEANEWCEGNGVEPPSGQAGERVTERNLRYYRTLGLMDGPESGGYGEKHFLQVVAVRLLQARGMSLRRIRELLYGRTLEELREIQERGLAEAREQSGPRWMGGGEELWRVIPLNEEFMLVSRRGGALSEEQLRAVVEALEARPTGREVRPAGE